MSDKIHDEEYELYPRPSRELTAPRPTREHKSIILPRLLPAVKSTKYQISPNVLRPYAPDIVNSLVPLHYTRAMLAVHGTRLMRAANAAYLDLGDTTRSLPATINVVLREDTPDPPTHVFAVQGLQNTTPSNTHKIDPYPREPQNRNGRVEFFSAHALVVATHCSRFPILPSGPKITGGTFLAGATLNLPVVSLKIPAPSTFPLLLAFFYTQSGPNLLGSLLPFLGTLGILPSSDDSEESDTSGIEQPTDESEDHKSDITETPYSNNDKETEDLSKYLSVLITTAPSRAELSKRLADMFTRVHLLSYAQKVFGMWKNAVALGVIRAAPVPPSWLWPDEQDIQMGTVQPQIQSQLQPQVHSLVQSPTPPLTFSESQSENAPELKVGWEDDLWTVMGVAWEILMEAISIRLERDRDMELEWVKKRAARAAKEAEEVEKAKLAAAERKMQKE